MVLTRIKHLATACFVVSIVDQKLDWEGIGADASDSRTRSLSLSLFSFPDLLSLKGFQD